jgi:sugar phosphate isomerase/epimerase
LYGISTWLYEQKGTGIEEALYAIADAGFKRIELWGNIFHLDPRIHPDIKSIKALVNKLDLWVHSIHTPFTGLNIGYPDIQLEKEWLRVVGESLEYGARLGADIAVVHTFSYKEEMDQKMFGESRAIIKEFIEKLNECSRQLNIRLAVENQLHFNTPHFTHSLQELSKLWDSNEIGFCFDIGHASINGVEPESEIAAAGERLISIHVSNNDGNTDLHSLPKDGVLDWEKVRQQLKKYKYTGPYILEVRGGNRPDFILDQLRVYIEEETKNEDSLF